MSVDDLFNSCFLAPKWAGASDSLVDPTHSHRLTSTHLYSSRLPSAKSHQPHTNLQQRTPTSIPSTRQATNIASPPSFHPCASLTLADSFPSAMGLHLLIYGSDMRLRDGSRGMTGWTVVRGGAGRCHVAPCATLQRCYGRGTNAREMRNGDGARAELSYAVHVELVDGSRSSMPCFVAAAFCLVVAVAGEAQTWISPSEQDGLKLRETGRHGERCCRCRCIV